MSFVDARLRVRYAETDQMGVVYHANYLVWMEVGRVEYCRASGVRYRDLEDAGILLAVVEANCRYLSPARYDDEVIVRTQIEDANPRMVRFGYELISAEDGRRLAYRLHQAHLLRAGFPGRQATARNTGPCSGIGSETGNNRRNMSTLSIRDLDLNGKRVFIRVDFNVPLARREARKSPATSASGRRCRPFNTRSITAPA